MIIILAASFFDYYINYNNDNYDNDYYNYESFHYDGNSLHTWSTDGWTATDAACSSRYSISNSLGISCSHIYDYFYF